MFNQLFKSNIEEQLEQVEQNFSVVIIYEIILTNRTIKVILISYCYIYYFTFFQVISAMFMQLFYIRL